VSAEMMLHLAPSMFGERERPLFRFGNLHAEAFRFDSGVCALRLRNELGQLLMLPFQGQQIWSAEFYGRPLTMVSMFAEPRPTGAYLENYGGFLLHCGAATMGVPGPDDTHALHGELPNAPYQQAYLVAGEDERGTYIGLGGRYQHTVAFGLNYLAEPLVKLYAGAAVFPVSLTVTNLKRSDMDLMYLAHINFRPVDRARLIYSAPCDPQHVRVRRSIPSHVQPKPGYREWMEELSLHPEKHNVLLPELVFDPEIVFSIDYLADGEGWAHSLQVHPDGAADYVAHRPSQLDKGIRWICRTPDQDALGLVLPATAEPEGYRAEKAKGNVKTLPGGARFACDLLVGALTAAEASRMEGAIARILSA